jgi:hypothetical protein
MRETHTPALAIALVHGGVPEWVTALDHYRARLEGLGYIKLRSGTFLATTLDTHAYKLQSVRWLPVGGRLRRESEKDPFATIALVPPNTDGLFIQYGFQNTWKRVSTWLAVCEIALTVVVLTSTASSIVYGGSWLITRRKRYQCSPERRMLFWLLTGSLSFTGFLGIGAS